MAVALNLLVFVYAFVSAVLPYTPCLIRRAVLFFGHPLIPITNKRCRLCCRDGDERWDQPTSQEQRSAVLPEFLLFLFLSCRNHDNDDNDDDGRCCPPLLFVVVVAIVVVVTVDCCVCVSCVCLCVHRGCEDGRLPPPLPCVSSA